MSLFQHLVDDAGLFPPEELSMAAALERYRADVAAGEAVLTGRFLCPAARLPELIGELREGDQVRLGLICPLRDDALATALARIAAEPRLTLAAVEGPLGTLDALAAIPPELPAFVETPRGDFAVLRAAHAAGAGLKVRCGGVRADLFPTAGELAAFIAACVELGAPFKATAGLHHALPYRDARTGFAHHGFVNLILATARAVSGGSMESLVAVLGQTDRDAIAAEAAALDDGLVAATRRHFVAYGSCSTREPIADLRSLALIPAGVAA